MAHRRLTSKSSVLVADLLTGRGPSPGDLALLHELLAGDATVLSHAVGRVRQELGIAPTSQIKSTGTILGEAASIRRLLAEGIQDLAGMRIVGPFDRSGQDAVVAQPVDLFAEEPRAPKVVDRRAEPVRGYRAVHVIVFQEQVPVGSNMHTPAA